MRHFNKQKVMCAVFITLHLSCDVFLLSSLAFHILIFSSDYKANWNQTLQELCLWGPLQIFILNLYLTRKMAAMGNSLSKISLSCTFSGVWFYFSPLFCLHSIERFPSKFVSIAEVNRRFIDILLCLGSILNVFHNKIQCILNIL